MVFIRRPSFIAKTQQQQIVIRPEWIGPGMTPLKNFQALK